MPWTSLISLSHEKSELDLRFRLSNIPLFYPVSPPGLLALPHPILSAPTPSVQSAIAALQPRLPTHGPTLETLLSMLGKWS